MWTLAVALATASVVLGVRAAPARDDVPGRFDYWLLALSWSPQYCATASRPEALQCAGSRPYGFIVHGLWPQYERGYPSQCGGRDELSREQVDTLLPLMPSRRLVEHEWRKHGRCSGLGPAGYVERLQRWTRQVTIPPRYRSLDRALNLGRTDIETDFIRSNPGHTPASVALQCKGNYLSEVRLCLDLGGTPRACGRDVRDRCGDRVTLRPLR